MSKYLEAAADLLKDVAAHSHNFEYKIKCARTYALLEAIDKGLMPEAVAEEIYDQLKSK